MNTIADSQEFLAMLTQSKLLDEPVLVRARELSGNQTASAVAEQLIQDGSLTRFQAKSLLAGRYRGFVIGPYRILDQIGRGGMGTVYLGEHANLKKRVAVKVLAKELTEDPKAVERFQREARAASALSHSNIVRVHHVGNTGGSHYIVMEYVEGATLEQVVDRKGPFSYTEAAQIALQTAAGLEHAHERGFVHRDIKPENLMVTKDGTVKILDMGLTKAINCAKDNLTGVLNTNAILGTIDYLSPEQAMQNDVDARSDIYSFGATLFTIMTGHSPYEGVPAKQKLLHHQTGAVPLLSAFRSDIPDELSAIIAKMMAKRPADRIQSAAEVAVKLLAWTSQNGIGAPLELPSRLLHAQANSGAQSMTPTARDTASRTHSGESSISRQIVRAVTRSSGVVKAEAPTPQPVPPKRNRKKIFWLMVPILGIVVGLVVAAVVLKLK